MDNVLVNAIARKLSKEQKPLEPGKYEFDTLISLRVSGTITKSADNEYTPTAKIPLKAAIGLMLEKAGIMRDHIETLLVEAMTEAVKAGEQGEEYVKELTKRAEEMEERVSKMLGKLPKATKEGPTNCKVTITEVPLTK